MTGYFQNKCSVLRTKAEFCIVFHYQGRQKCTLCISQFQLGLCISNPRTLAHFLRQGAMHENNRFLNFSITGIFASFTMNIFVNRYYKHPFPFRLFNPEHDLSLFHYCLLWNPDTEVCIYMLSCRSFETNLPIF